MLAEIENKDTPEAGLEVLVLEELHVPQQLQEKQQTPGGARFGSGLGPWAQGKFLSYGYFRTETV